MKRRLSFFTALLLALLLPLTAYSEENRQDNSEGYFTVHDQDGNVLFRTSEEVSTDDEYISGDNKRYRVTQVDEAAKRAAAVFVEDVILPEVSWNTADQNWKPTIALYCTHTSESYIQGDGTESEANGGGILDVAAQLREALKNAGCECVLDDTNHVPHDAGAYRRSRKTAESLMQQSRPTLLLDIHRDGVPADEYAEEINNDEISAVRIVIGKGNQNYAVNEELAQTIKSVADSQYPGLIKDIYLGKGDYNQDLMPRCLLLEFGTSEGDKEHAEKSTNYVAQVIATALGAQTAQAEPLATGQAPSGTGAAPQATGGGQQNAAPQATAKPAAGSSSAWKSAGWIILVLAAVGGLILLFFVRSGKRAESSKHLFKEMTGLGSKPDEDRDEKK